MCRCQSSICKIPVSLCVKLLRGLHRLAQHTSLAPTWLSPQHRNNILQSRTHHKSDHSNSCSYRKAALVSPVSYCVCVINSTRFQLLVMVAVKPDDIAIMPVWYVVSLITYYIYNIYYISQVFHLISFISSCIKKFPFAPHNRTYFFCHQLNPMVDPLEGA